MRPDRKPLSDVHPDWRQTFPDTRTDWTSRDGVEVSYDGDHICIIWEEGADDHYGTSTRSVSVPRSVMLAVLGVPDAR